MSFKGIKNISSSKISLPFISGVAFGTLGLKALTSRDAKKTYSKVLAKGYHMKSGLDDTLSSIKQHADDIVADARDIYESENKKENLALLEEEKHEF